MEKSELLIEALSREVFEELNIKIDIKKVLFLKSYKKNLKRENLNLIFLNVIVGLVKLETMSIKKLDGFIL